MLSDAVVLEISCVNLKCCTVCTPLAPRTVEIYIFSFGTFQTYILEKPEIFLCELHSSSKSADVPDSTVQYIEQPSPIHSAIRALQVGCVRNLQSPAGSFPQGLANSKQQDTAAALYLVVRCWKTHDQRCA